MRLALLSPVKTARCGPPCPRIRSAQTSPGRKAGALSFCGSLEAEAPKGWARKVRRSPPQCGIDSGTNIRRAEDISDTRAAWRICSYLPAALSQRGRRSPLAVAQERKVRGRAFRPALDTLQCCSVKPLLGPRRACSLRQSQVASVRGRSSLLR